MLTAAMLAALTFLACLPVYRLLRGARRFDMPNERSSHTHPTPRGGGVAIVAATFALAVFLTLGAQTWTDDVWIGLLGAAALAGVGLLDDVTGLDPRVRLPAQVTVGAAVGAGLSGWMGALLGAVIVATAVNMVNFMDGINGLCAGHAAVWGGAALAGGLLSGSDALSVLGSVSLGGAVGFLPWNVPRARMFLGDSGSYFFGGLAGIGVLIGLLSAIDGGNASLKVLALVCAPYLLFALDTATTIGRRAKRGENLLEAHRDHVYQQLVHAGGWPHWAVSLAAVTVSMLVTASFTLSSLFGVATSLTAAVLYVNTPRLSHNLASF